MAKYSEEFKKKAIRLSDGIGNKKAAAQLGILMSKMKVKLLLNNRDYL